MRNLAIEESTGIQGGWQGEQLVLAAAEFCMSSVMVLTGLLCAINPKSGNTPSFFIGVGLILSTDGIRRLAETFSEPR